MREIIKETKNEIDSFIEEHKSIDERLLRSQKNLAFLIKEFERLIDNFYKENKEKINNE